MQLCVLTTILSTSLLTRLPTLVAFLRQHPVQATLEDEELRSYLLACFTYTRYVVIRYSFFV